jgi:hypothetical protein
MTTEREMLEFAAKAVGVELINLDYEFGPYIAGTMIVWNPLKHSSACAAMCAKLEIDTYWVHTNWKVTSVECGVKQILEEQLLKDHNNDREAAWRYAATMVAAKIGGMK